MRYRNIECTPSCINSEHFVRNHKQFTAFHAVFGAVDSLFIVVYKILFEICILLSIFIHYKKN